MQFDHLSGLIQKGLLLLLSFSDDIALFFLARLGFHWAWLQWLSTALLIATLAYLGLQLVRHYYGSRGNAPAREQS
ncbi:MAG: hypothetical protein WBC73_23725 [Phormidesmis sp.]